MRISRLTLQAAALVLLASSAQAADITIGTALGHQGGFHQSIACGIKAAAEKLGVAVNIQAIQNYGPAEQVPLLNSVFATSPDAIILDPTNRAAMVAPIKEVADAGVKVVAVDTTLDDVSMLTSRVGTDNVEIGRELARALAAQIGDKSGKVALLSSSPGISTVDARIEGFEEAIKEFPNLTFIGTTYSGNDVAGGVSAFTSLLSANPDLIGAGATNENASIGVATAIRNAGVSDAVAAVSVDASEALTQALKEGSLDALVVQRPYDMGYRAVELAVAALKGEAVPEAEGTGALIATRDNIAEPDVASSMYNGNCI
jgi:ribose transport system substrate-binding protein